MATGGNKGSKAEVLSRGDIINDVAAQSDLPQSKADQVIKAYEQAIIRTLSNGGEVRIAGFGTFKTSFREARSGRNPQTGATVTIAARTVARFSPSSTFKQAIEGSSGSGSKGGSKGGAKGGAAKGGSGGGSKSSAAKGGGASGGGAAKGGAKGGASAGGAKGGAAKGGSGGGSKGGAKGSKK